ncbi:MAG: phenylacetate--CoA ligase family protein [Piscinibacter sp.]|nr:phenylacetate--CoA ligase family protein [Piscinibacter sp.]
MNWTACDPWRTAGVGLDVLAAVHDTPAGLARRRAERLRALLAAACRGSALYRERLGGNAARPLAAIAPVGKDELMARFADWVTDPALRLDELRAFIADRGAIGRAFLGRYWVWESSGSSGRPGLYVQDAAAMAVYDALEALRRPLLTPLRRLLDPCGLAERSAFVGATGGHFASTVSVERLRALQPWLGERLRSFSFLQPVAELVAQLNRFAPTLLATYPTMALLLAEERAGGRLRIAPQEIWTGGEGLSAPMRAQIERSFGCPVAHSYGASEFLALAAPCRFGALHLNSDWVILEPVDERGAPVGPGEAGATTLLTNLANHVQPLIRYDLGDRVTLHPQHCACGSPLPVLEVQGRVDDSLVLRDTRGHAVRLLPLALTTVMEDEAGVLDFQIVQRGERALELSVGAPEGEAALVRSRAALRAYLRSQGLAGVQLRAHTGPPPQRGRSGKLQRVVAAGA